MSDPSTPVDDIVVRGQRRQNGSTNPFPPEPSYDPPLPGQDATIEPEEGLHACDDPVKRIDWNADATAAAAQTAFEAKAAELGDSGLYEREFGAAIYMRADGSTYLGRITYGDKMGSSVEIDESNATPDNLIGEIHSHPGGQMTPSTADWQRVDINAAYTGKNYRSYIVARDTSVPNSPFKVRVYDKSSVRDFTKPGPEVNPNGQSCPIN